MTTKKARENKGKTVTIRPEPRASGWKGWLFPGHEVEYVDIVDDLDYPDNPDKKWLKLTSNNYVNYKYPPAGIRYILLDDVVEFDTIKVVFLQDGVVVSEREFYDTRPTA